MIFEQSAPLPEKRRLDSGSASPRKAPGSKPRNPRRSIHVSLTYRYSNSFATIQSAGNNQYGYRGTRCNTGRNTKVDLKQTSDGARTAARVIDHSRNPADSCFYGLNRSWEHVSDLAPVGTGWNREALASSEQRNDGSNRCSVRDRFAVPS